MVSIPFGLTWTSVLHDRMGALFTVYVPIEAHALFTVYVQIEAHAPIETHAPIKAHTPF